METNNTMEIKKAVDFITPFLQVSLVPYYNENKELAIGYGQTLGINSATTWTQQQAEKDLFIRVRQSKQLVINRVSGSSNLNANQLLALTSLFFDVGFEEIARSRLLDYLESRNYKMASAEFMYFNKHGRAVSVKKTARRKKEQFLFNSKE